METYVVDEWQGLVEAEESGFVSLNPKFYIHV